MEGGMVKVWLFCDNVITGWDVPELPTSFCVITAVLNKQYAKVLLR